MTTAWKMASSREISSLAQCINKNGRIDTQKLLLYQQQRRREIDDELDQLLCFCQDEEEDEEDSFEIEPPVKKPRIRSCYRRSITQQRMSDGRLVEMVPTTSPWFSSYISNPQVGDEKFERLFRLRFRCSFAMFQKLLQKVKENALFGRWDRRDCIDRPSSPIELLLLGSLRYIGRGWTFDDLEEATGISNETHRQFFHIFIRWGSTDFFQEQVYLPTTSEEWDSHMIEFSKAGLNGCIASMDATHIAMERCPHVRCNHHRGPKIKAPSRTYNVCVNHRRRILSTTGGHPARWNDKTLVLYDPLAVGLNQGNILSDNQFKLLSRGINGDIVEVKYNGAYMITDNGYLRWSCTMPPFKETPYTSQLRWSKWVESMRKDVECCFGIMKGRFRILKCGIRLHTIKSCDRVWLTCCALHNFLLTEDGMDTSWEDGIPTDWEGEAGEHDPDDVIFYSNPILRLHNADVNELRHYDTSGIGFGSDVVSVASSKNQLEDFQLIDTHSNDVHSDDSILLVKNLSFAYFREKLVEHFNILFDDNKIVWPRRLEAKK